MQIQQQTDNWRRHWEPQPDTDNRQPVNPLLIMDAEFTKYWGEPLLSLSLWSFGNYRYSRSCFSSILSYQATQQKEKAGTSRFMDTPEPTSEPDSFENLLKRNFGWTKAKIPYPDASEALSQQATTRGIWSTTEKPSLISVYHLNLNLLRSLDDPTTKRPVSSYGKKGLPLPMERPKYYGKPVDLWKTVSYLRSAEAWKETVRPCALRFAYYEGA